MNCFLYVYVSLNLVAAQSHCLNIDEHGDIALFKFTLEYNYELFLNRLGLTVYKRTLLIILKND